MRTKEELPECPVAKAVSLIGGKWKLLLLRNLKERPWRFNELQRSIDGILLLQPDIPAVLLLYAYQSPLYIVYHIHF